MGFAVLMVNYRGSIGFGADFVNCLPGRCGELDINDCMDAVLHLFDEEKVDGNRLAVIGGSHGGFIAGTLIGRGHPILKFKACVMRNPVTDIPGMTVATDIPDWCFTETGSNMPSLVPDLTAIGKMHTCSPIATIDNVKTPTLFIIGGVDKRVPPSQGLSMYYALRERNIPTRALFYPKNGHAIAGPDTEPDQWVNAAIWCNKYFR